MGKGINKMLEIIGVSKEDEEDFDNTFEEDEDEEDMDEQDGITGRQPDKQFPLCQKRKQKGGSKHE